MARIRTIKPEFNKSKSVASMSVEAQLFMVKLIVEVDDQGRLEWLPRTILGALYPHNEEVDTASLERLVSELEEAGIFMRWEADGHRYGCFVNWAEHQKIDRPSKARIPAPPVQDAGEKPVNNGESTETLAQHSRDIREDADESSRVEEGNGKREMGNGSSLRGTDRPSQMESHPETPFGIAERVLTEVASEIGASPPTAEAVKRHIAHSTALQVMVRQYGVPRTIQIAVYAMRHKQGIGWKGILEGAPAFESQMTNGVKSAYSGTNVLEVASRAVGL